MRFHGGLVLSEKRVLYFFTPGAMHHGLRLVKPLGIPHGTIYRGLASLVERGLLESHWESDSERPTHTGPRRKLYRLTAKGEEIRRHLAQPPW